MFEPIVWPEERTDRRSGHTSKFSDSLHYRRGMVFAEQIQIALGHTTPEYVLNFHMYKDGNGEDLPWNWMNEHRQFAEEHARLVYVTIKAHDLMMEQRKKDRIEQANLRRAERDERQRLKLPDGVVCVTLRGGAVEHRNRGGVLRRFADAAAEKAWLLSDRSDNPGEQAQETEKRCPWTNDRRSKFRNMSDDDIPPAWQAEGVSKVVIIWRSDVRQELRIFCPPAAAFLVVRTVLGPRADSQVECMKVRDHRSDFVLTLEQYKAFENFTV